MSVFIKILAILALMKQTMQPDMKARIDTLEMTVFCCGHIELIPPIKTPNDPGLANPHIANDAIAELRNEINFAFFISPKR